MQHEVAKDQACRGGQGGAGRAGPGQAGQVGMEGWTWRARWCQEWLACTGYYRLEQAGWVGGVGGRAWWGLVGPGGGASGMGRDWSIGLFLL